MKTSIEITLDDLVRTLRSTAHGLADAAEAGYLSSNQPGAKTRTADSPKMRLGQTTGDSHDRAGH